MVVKFIELESGEMEVQKDMQMSALSMGRQNPAME